MASSALNRTFVPKKTLKSNNSICPSPVMLVGGTVLLVGGFVYWHHRVSLLLKKKEELENRIIAMQEELKNGYATEMHHQTLACLNATNAELTAAKAAADESSRETANLKKEKDQAETTNKELRDQIISLTYAKKYGQNQYDEEDLDHQVEDRKCKRRRTRGAFMSV